MVEKSQFSSILLFFEKVANHWVLIHGDPHKTSTDKKYVYEW